VKEKKNTKIKSRTKKKLGFKFLRLKQLFWLRYHLTVLDLR